MTDLNRYQLGSQIQCGVMVIYIHGYQDYMFLCQRNNILFIFISKLIQMSIKGKDVLILSSQSVLNLNPKDRCLTTYKRYQHLNSRFVPKEMELIRIVFGNAYI